MRCTRVLFALAATLVLALPAVAGEPGLPLLSADFEQNPLTRGWWRGGYPNDQRDAAWTDATSSGGRHCLVVREGWWSSPRLEVEPLRYYRLRFHAAAEGKAYWVAQFHDQVGEPLVADHYSSIDPSADWQAHEFCFRARVNAATAEVRFRAIDAPVYVDDVSVEPVSRPEVAAWADAVYATVPPIDAKAVPRAGRHLARTMKKLRRGETLRIVMLGDSIINDTGNSAYDVLLERKYPGSHVEVITSVRGGTGCQYYQAENRAGPYVLDLEPDLLVIGGISNGYDVQAIRSVIRQVRAKADPDILLLPGAVTPLSQIRDGFRHLPEPQRRRKLRQIEAYRPGLAKLAEQEGCEFLDIRGLWDAYVEGIHKPPMWLHRDPVHANARGRQVLARLLEAYFRP